VEQDGIVFLDEIDKIASRGEMQGADVSRQGVQRDLLPLVEGTAVTTKYGMIRTDHILFIASGAFHLAKPSDLIPELQGRLPIRVELSSLSVEDFVRILTATDACLTRQYQALLATEGVELVYTPEGVRRLAEIAFAVNERNREHSARAALHRDGEAARAGPLQNVSARSSLRASSPGARHVGGVDGDPVQLAAGVVVGDLLEQLLHHGVEAARADFSVRSFTAKAISASRRTPSGV